MSTRYKRRKYGEGTPQSNALNNAEVTGEMTRNQLIRKECGVKAKKAAQNDSE
jgi:hypothetical protein